jgi:hypothetical protein
MIGKYPRQANDNFPPADFSDLQLGKYFQLLVRSTYEKTSRANKTELEA